MFIIMGRFQFDGWKIVDVSSVVLFSLGKRKERKEKKRKEKKRKEKKRKEKKRSEKKRKWMLKHTTNIVLFSQKTTNKSEKCMEMNTLWTT